MKTYEMSIYNLYTEKLNNKKGNTVNWSFWLTVYFVMLCLSTGLWYYIVYPSSFTLTAHLYDSKQSVSLVPCQTTDP